MSLLRQQSRQQLTIEKPFHDVFVVIQRACLANGKVTSGSEMTGTLVFKNGLAATGLSNPATVRISVERDGEFRSSVTFEGQSLDGMVGLDSAGKAIDQLVRTVDSLLTTGKLPAKPKSNVPVLLAVAAAVLVLIVIVCLKAPGWMGY